MPGDVFQHDFEDETCHWVEVAGERIASESQRLQGDGSAACERIDDQGRLLRMRCANQCACGVQIVLFGRVVPVGEVRDEL